MALFSLRHRLPLLVSILVAASRGDASGDDYNPSICKLQPYPYTCGGVNISYPFYLSDQTADVLGNSNASCGYPGLAIDCVDDKYPILQLGSSQDYSYSYNVTAIDYANSSISLADPDVLDDESCPRVDHNVTVPSAFWLSLSLLSQYTVRYLLYFANCSIPIFPAPGQGNINSIACSSSDGGGDGYSFVIPLEMPHELLLRECNKAFLVPVLQNASIEIDQQWSIDGYRSVLRQGFQLGWNLSRRSELCTKCEDSIGRCAYSRDRDGEFVGCLCTNGRVNDKECTNGKPFLSANTTFYVFQ